MTFPRNDAAHIEAAEAKRRRRAEKKAMLDAMAKAGKEDRP